MAIYHHEVQNNARSFIATIENMTARQKEATPTAAFARNFNRLLASAIEVNPSTDPRLWPEPISIEDGSSARYPALVSATYVEIEVYARQVKELLTPLPAPSIVVNDPPTFDAQHSFY